MSTFGLAADRILTPSGFTENKCVVIEGRLITAIAERHAIPADIPLIALSGTLSPGFIDLQVNGGGGALFNDSPTADTIIKIAEAHRKFGTTGLFPTLISDDLAVIAAAIRAVEESIEAGVPGILGIHLEGPFLNPAKKGIHDSSKFRQLDDDAIDLLSSLKGGKTLVTLAPEQTTSAKLRALVDRGVIVAAGHTSATYEQATLAIAAGLSGFTHLFNAMSALMSRAPGAVGAALDSRSTWASIIADGHHVHPAAMRIALAAKGLDRLVLVTDAMPPVGTTDTNFELGGTQILVEDGKCVSADGTLAGANLDMARAVRNAAEMLCIPLDAAIAMASANPATAVGLDHVTGTIQPQMRADLVLLDDDGTVRSSWIAGERYYP